MAQKKNHGPLSSKESEKIRETWIDIMIDIIELHRQNQSEAMSAWYQTGADGYSKMSGTSPMTQNG